MSNGKSAAPPTLESVRTATVILCPFVGMVKPEMVDDVALVIDEQISALAEENALLRKALADLHVLLDFDEPIRANEVQMFDDPCLINEAYAQARAALEVKP